MKIPDITFGKTPKVVFWESTKACDFACKHCRAESIPERHPDELDTEEAKSMLKSLQSDQKTTLVFTGGDPLKRADLFELLDFSSDLGFRSVVAPSGTKMIKEEILDSFLNVGVQGLALSLDGSTAKLHDDFRGEEGVFDWTMEAAGLCNTHGLPLQINTAVSEETVHNLPDILSLLRDLDIVRWSLFFLVPTGRGRLLNPLSPSKVEEILNWLAEISQETSFLVKTTEAHHYRRVLIQKGLKDGKDLEEILGLQGSERPNIRGLGINDGNGVAFISHTGNIYPSGFLPLSAGNVREKGALAIYRNSELFTNLRDRSLRKGKCGECEFKGICGGSRAQAYATHKDYLAADPTCIYQPGGVKL